MSFFEKSCAPFDKLPVLREWHAPDNDLIAFPLGGMGSGMICIEGSGTFSHISIRNRPELNFEPMVFAAVSIRGKPDKARVLEGPVPKWKMAGKREQGFLRTSSNGLHGTHFGLPRFETARFRSWFPFSEILLEDDHHPLSVRVIGWSPFIPNDEDASSLPQIAVEYELENTTEYPVSGHFWFNAENFLKCDHGGEQTQQLENGFRHVQTELPGQEHLSGSFTATVDSKDVTVDPCWFRGGWFDALTVLWKNSISNDRPKEENGSERIDGSPGASLAVPYNLKPGTKRVFRVLISWYFPTSNLNFGAAVKKKNETYVPWYVTQYSDAERLHSHWLDQCSTYKNETLRFTESLYQQDISPVFMEAASANLSILKSPTLLREATGALWGYEGCQAESGCCHGTCTHVYNYVQAIAELFPRLERIQREIEFSLNQQKDGFQVFRGTLPVAKSKREFHAAADGQLGGIIKVFREWRQSGDTDWLQALYPAVEKSLNYCIEQWDPGRRGLLEEPHHNTYDIEFWGPEPMGMSFYYAAVKAAIRMGEALNQNIDDWNQLLPKIADGLRALYNGEFFEQRIKWKDLRSDPLDESKWQTKYSEEARELLMEEGPKYQIGGGCLSDGVLGFWLAEISGLEIQEFREEIESHLRSVYRYNFRESLKEHVNPQRPAFAQADEGGLLLCTWPRGNTLTLPFVYSNEIWSGVEYQVASHMLLHGFRKEAEEIVATSRSRYDGTRRNPFCEFECGFWYIRSLSSFALINGALQDNMKSES